MAPTGELRREIIAALRRMSRRTLRAASSENRLPVLPAWFDVPGSSPEHPRARPNGFQASVDCAPVGVPSPRSTARGEPLLPPWLGLDRHLPCYARARVLSTAQLDAEPRAVIESLARDLAARARRA